MKTNHSILSILLLFLVISACRCKDKKKPCQDPSNPDCENYDPCNGKKATADFTLRQWDGWVIKPEDEVPEDCDTILLHGIRAQASMKNANSYSWTIGTDDREFTNEELRMTFSDYKNDDNNLNPNNPSYFKPIPITLTVRNTQSQCVSAADTLIQKTRNLVFVSKYNPEPNFGKFIGKIDNDENERIIEMYYFFRDSIVQPENVRIHFINFPNLSNKDTIELRSFAKNKLKSFKTRLWWDIGYEKFWSAFDRAYPLDGVNMFKFQLDRVNEQDFVTISYRYVTDAGDYKEYTFKGKKIE